MKNKKIQVLSMAVLMLITGCSSQEINNQGTNNQDGNSNIESMNVSETQSNSTVSTEILDLDQMFTSRDLEVTYDTASTTQIVLGNEDVRITQEGVYLLSGTLENGQVIIEADNTAKIQLILDNVTISCDSSAPIYVKSANKVFITLADGSQNSLSVLGEYKNIDENNIDSVIFSKSDITFNGNGSLSIYAENGHGIVGKDDMVVTGGTYEIVAKSHGISANNSIRIADGTFQITSGKDGMQADHEDSAKGYIYIVDGSFTIDAQQDGISASSTLQIMDGEFTISSGGGFEKVLNIITRGEGSGGTVSATSLLTESMKGLKALNIFISGGDISISSYEDAVHANNELFISDGNIVILSGDDALHADNIVSITGGTIVVENAYEGIEGDYVYIIGGDMKVNVLDDAINAGSSNGYINISGGNILLIASGDGVDSNGNFYMSGGTLMIDSNPVYSGGDSAIDITGSIEITGGTITDENGNAINANSSTGGGPTNQRR